MTNGETTEPHHQTALAEIRFMVPRAWKDEFQRAAQARALSMADLQRQLMRDFLRPDPPTAQSPG